jgi:hypothetical protein
MQESYYDHVVYEEYVKVPTWLFHKMQRACDELEEVKKQRDEYFEMLWEKHMESIDFSRAIDFANALTDYTEKVREDTIKEIQK